MTEVRPWAKSESEERGVTPFLARFQKSQVVFFASATRIGLGDEDEVVFEFRESKHELVAGRVDMQSGGGASDARFGVPCDGAFNVSFAQNKISVPAAPRF